MKRGVFALVALSAFAASTLVPHPRKLNWCPSRPAAKPRHNIAGTKLQRKADAGVLTMRAPGGVVSQLCREIQQRNFNQGDTK